MHAEPNMDGLKAASNSHQCITVMSGFKYNSGTTMTICMLSLLKHSLCTGQQLSQVQGGDRSFKFKLGNTSMLCMLRLSRIVPASKCHRCSDGRAGQWCIWDSLLQR